MKQVYLISNRQFLDLLNKHGKLESLVIGNMLLHIHPDGTPLFVDYDWDDYETEDSPAIFCPYCKYHRYHYVTKPRDVNLQISDDVAVKKCDNCNNIFE